MQYKRLLGFCTAVVFALGTVADPQTEVDRDDVGNVGRARFPIPPATYCDVAARMMRLATSASPWQTFFGGGRNLTHVTCLLLQSISNQDCRDGNGIAPQVATSNPVQSL